MCPIRIYEFHIGTKRDEQTVQTLMKRGEACAHDIIAIGNSGVALRAIVAFDDDALRYVVCHPDIIALRIPVIVAGINWQGPEGAISASTSPCPSWSVLSSHGDQRKMGLPADVDWIQEIVPFRMGLQFLVDLLNYAEPLDQAAKDRHPWRKPSYEFQVLVDSSTPSDLLRNEFESEVEDFNRGHATGRHFHSYRDPLYSLPGSARIHLWPHGHIESPLGVPPKETYDWFKERIRAGMEAKVDAIISYIPWTYHDQRGWVSPQRYFNDYQHDNGFPLQRNIPDLGHAHIQTRHGYLLTVVDDLADQGLLAGERLSIRLGAHDARQMNGTPINFAAGWEINLERAAMMGMYVPFELLNFYHADPINMVSEDVR
ncbi:hypothetical protein [Sorangium sp. So ce381]|uniref:hypothetical protein n=1 Tax=Sorangium sp. So ce381 TaxID=3133307 RepID=UPI003F5B7053